MYVLKMVCACVLCMDRRVIIAREIRLHCSVGPPCQARLYEGVGVLSNTAAEGGGVGGLGLRTAEVTTRFRQVMRAGVVCSKKSATKITT